MEANKDGRTWQIGASADVVATATYRLPSYGIGRGHKVVVHSGHGNDRRRHLYAGWGFTWNNDGDTADLAKPGGGGVDSCSWGDGSGTVHC